MSTPSLFSKSEIVNCLITGLTLDVQNRVQRTAITEDSSWRVYIKANNFRATADGNWIEVNNEYGWSNVLPQTMQCWLRHENLPEDALTPATPEPQPAGVGGGEGPIDEQKHESYIVTAVNYEGDASQFTKTFVTDETAAKREVENYKQLGWSEVSYEFGDVNVALNPAPTPAPSAAAPILSDTEWCALGTSWFRGEVKPGRAWSESGYTSIGNFSAFGGRWIHDGVPEYPMTPEPPAAPLPSDTTDWTAFPPSVYPVPGQSAIADSNYAPTDWSGPGRLVLDGNSEYDQPAPAAPPEPPGDVDRTEYVKAHLRSNWLPNEIARLEREINERQAKLNQARSDLADAQKVLKSFKSEGK